MPDLTPQTPPLPTAAPTAEPTPQQAPQAPEQPRASAAERRISQLFAQKKEAEERVQATSTENETLRTELLRAQDELNQLRALTQYGQPSLPNAPVAPSTSGNGIEDVLAKKFQEFEARIEQRRQREVAVQALRQSQVSSFQAAASEFPEVSDPNNVIFKLADRIYRNDKLLQVDPQGPYRAVLMARGALIENPDQGVMTPTRAAAAGAVPGAPNVGSPGAKELETLQGQLKELVERQQTGGGDPVQMYVQAQNLKERIRALEPKK